MENEGTAPRILNLGTWCRRVLSALPTPGTDRIDCWVDPRDGLDLYLPALRPWMICRPLTNLTTSGLNFRVVHLVTFRVQGEQRAATCFGRYQATFRLHATCKTANWQILATHWHTLLMQFSSIHNCTERELSGNKLYWLAFDNKKSCLLFVGDLTAGGLSTFTNVQSVFLQ